MKVNFVHICEKAFFSDSRKLCLIEIFNGIDAASFPVGHPGFSVVLNFSGEIVDETKIVIESPSEVELFSATLDPGSFKGDKESNAVVVNIIGFEFPEEGNYKILLKTAEEIISPEREDFLVARRK